jgi:6-pyruvoyltetrahydropterin/6-carboxytetrahydropterin synthase
LLINEEDPHLDLFKEMDRKGLCQLRVVPHCGAEGMSRYFYDYANDLVRRKSKGRAWVHRVTMWENDKNSATYEER